MDKSTFMKELEQSLSVLQEDELRDILNEYELHVDMKVKSGLSEEEAIADFGNLSELSAEILEAYHVRADYTDGYAGTGRKTALADRKEASAEKLEKARNTWKQVGDKTAAGVKGAGCWVWGVILFWMRQIGRPFRWGLNAWRQRRDKKTAKEAVIVDEAFIDMAADDRLQAAGIPAAKGAVRRGVHRTVRGAARLTMRGLHLTAGAVIWMLRMAWNVCCVGFFLLCGGLGLFFLFGFGMLAVLLFQRYPLAGVTIGCFGVMVCLFSAAWLGLTLLWRKNKSIAGVSDGGGRPPEEPGTVHEGEEEQYA